MDRGRPWQYVISGNDYYICSDDLKHDVCLHLRGDFADDLEKINYAKWVADVLNNSVKGE